MRVSEFEQKVWETESVRIVIRANPEFLVEEYEWDNAADKTWRVNEWLEKRIHPKIHGREVVVLQGDGEQPHGGVILRTLRNSYNY